MNKVRRRGFLAGCLGGAAALACGGLAKTAHSSPAQKDTVEEVVDKVMDNYSPVKVVDTSYPRPLGITNEMNELLIASCRPAYGQPSVMKRRNHAHKELAKAIELPLRVSILRNTKVEFRKLTAYEYNKTKSLDIGLSCDMRMKYGRDCRWDIIARMIQRYEEDLVKKILSYAKHDSYLIRHDFFDDITMVKQGKLGFFGWVEMVNPNERAFMEASH